LASSFSEVLIIVSMKAERLNCSESFRKQQAMPQRTAVRNKKFFY